LSTSEQERETLKDKISKILEENEYPNDSLRLIIDLVLNCKLDDKTFDFYNKLLDKIKADEYFLAYCVQEVALAISVIISEIDLDRKKITGWELSFSGIQDNVLYKYRKMIYREFIGNDIEFLKQYEYLKTREEPKEPEKARTVDDIQDEIVQTKIKLRKKQSELIHLKEKMDVLNVKIKTLEVEKEGLEKNAV